MYGKLWDSNGVLNELFILVKWIDIIVSWIEVVVWFLD